ncbi:hypothetical protein Glove_196g44 [Diversispora epigaea]|uniref:Uncharacterized protein n=1 Tax=Diversispora epigaea TaxID=1348612 RepID=A0A397IKW2_9GLOM|nr:hypothetical protein Glove_196g44 [Diversispora epigaea]
MSFSYKRPTDLERHTHDYIDDYGFKLRMERINSDIAQIYFLDEYDELTRVPHGIKCFNTRNQTKEYIQELNGIRCFLITWQNDYVVKYFGNEILSIINQKQQSVYRHY